MKPSSPLIEKTHSRYGEFYVPFCDDLISNSLRQYGEWAQCEIETLCSFINAGDTVIDAGAYIGTHSRAFSAQVGKNGKVFAFEPAPDSFEVLAHNARCAPLQNIHAKNLGLGAAQESRTLHIEEEQHNRASASAEGKHTTDDIQIQVQPLDSCNIPRVSFMKVDVEGMELQLLKGAEHTIRRDLPIIFLEVNTLQGSYEFLHWADEHGYAAFGINVPAFNPCNYTGQTANIFGSAREVALLLIHRSNLTKHAGSLSRHHLPQIDNMDALALLLLHKPQYLHEALGKAKPYQAAGLFLETPDKLQVEQLRALLQAKEAALSDAAAAYTALREALENKEYELATCLRELDASTVSKDRALEEAASAYKALSDALDEKDKQIRKLQNSLDPPPSAPSHEQPEHASKQLLELLSLKDESLKDAARAYTALHEKLASKEDELKTHLSELGARLTEKDSALAEAASAYAALLDTLKRKEHEFETNLNELNTRVLEREHALAEALAAHEKPRSSLGKD
ncbi:MAG: FkbM family methyltransferase [Pseudomonadaceae bacterium]|nr:FkbM family methyltransferase [Pseudomonadaceae bacterium]